MDSMEDFFSGSRGASALTTKIGVFSSRKPFRCRTGLKEFMPLIFIASWEGSSVLKSRNASQNSIFPGEIARKRKNSRLKNPSPLVSLPLLRGEENLGER